jgi:type IV secretion system protein VirB10
MRNCLVFAAAACALAAEPGSEFAGVWILDGARSQVAALPTAVPTRLEIVVEQGRLKCAACGVGGWTFAADGKTHANVGAGHRTSIQTKWEGSALLVNALVSGPQSHVVSDRWKLSRSGRTLTILRQVQRGGGESESTLLFNREGSEPRPDPAPAVAAPAVTQSPRAPREFVVESGRRIPLRMLSDVTTKTVRAGGRVYLETSFPVLVDQRQVIPPGSQVSATVSLSQQAGRVKGQSELMFAFQSVTLPNGVTHDFRARTVAAELGRGSVDREGAIQGPRDRKGDVVKTGESTAAGTAVGAVAAGGTGAAIGAAAGAAVGLGRVLRNRGPDVVLRRGEIVEVILDRDLHFVEKDVNFE